MGKIFTDETGQEILQAIKNQNTILQNTLGTLSGLRTTDKTSLAAAVNEVFDNAVSNSARITKLEELAASILGVTNSVIGNIERNE